MFDDLVFPQGLPSHGGLSKRELFEYMQVQAIVTGVYSGMSAAMMNAQLSGVSTEQVQEFATVIIKTLHQDASNIAASLADIHFKK